MNLSTTVEVFNDAACLLTASFIGASFVEWILPDQSTDRPLLLEYIEGVVGMAAFVLLAVTLSDFLAPFTYGVSEPLIFVLLMPFLAGNALRKLRRTQKEIESMM